MKISDGIWQIVSKKLAEFSHGFPPLSRGDTFFWGDDQGQPIFWKWQINPLANFKTFFELSWRKWTSLPVPFDHQTFLHLAVEMWQEFLRISEEYLKSKFSVGMRRLVASWLVRERRMAWFWDVTCGGHCLLQIAWLWLSHPQSLMEQNPLSLLYTSPPETKRDSTIHA